MQVVITTVGPYAKMGRPVVQVSVLNLRIPVHQCSDLRASPNIANLSHSDNKFNLYNTLAHVQACVENGTHYCDLTGEALFIRRMMEEFHDEARAKNVKIVHSCGFDSVPGDVLTLMAAHHMKQHHNKTLGETTVIVGDGASCSLQI